MTTMNEREAMRRVAADLWARVDLHRGYAECGDVATLRAALALAIDAVAEAARAVEAVADAPAELLAGAVKRNRVYRLHDVLRPDAD